MALISTAQDGPYSDTATWVGGVVPVPGDLIFVTHNLSIDVNINLGDGLASSIAIEVLGAAGGNMTIEEDVTVTLTSKLESSGDLIMQAGTTLEFDNASDILFSQDPNGTDYKALYCNGTAAKHVTITSIGAGRAYMDGISIDPGYCRIVAFFTDFSLMGSATNTTALRWNQLDVPNEHNWLMQDCTIDQCYQVAGPSADDEHGVTHTGKIEFIRVKVTNSIRPSPLPDDNWRPISVTCWQGQICQFTDCDFDDTVALLHPDEWGATGTVFRNGLYRLGGSNLFVSGPIGLFEKNLIHITEETGSNYEWGDTITDCYMVMTNATNNPHLGAVDGGTGTIEFNNCIWETTTTAANPEGDGMFPVTPLSGTQSENKLLINNCIICPNGNGSESADSHGFTAFTTLTTSPNYHADVINCSLFVGTLGSINLGESASTVAGNVGTVRNNLFYGKPGDTVRKMQDLGNTVLDTVDNTLVTNNAGFRVDAGAADPGSGRGYDNFLYSTPFPNIIGADDLDEQDPGCPDINRGVNSWAGDITTAMDRVSFTDNSFTIDDLLEHVRDGWRPTNEDYGTAGFGGTHIGAVALSTTPPAPAAPTKSLLSQPQPRVTALWHHALPLLENTMGVVLPVAATGTHLLGVVKARQTRGSLVIGASTTATPGAGESFTLNLVYLNAAGQTVVSPAVVLDAACLIPGTTCHSPRFRLNVPPNTVLRLQVQYIAGGAPVAPALTVNVQLF